MAPWPEPGRSIDRIFIGSCLHQNRAQPVWPAVFAREPDLALLIGDNVYGDAEEPAVLAGHYRRQLSNPGVRRLLSEVPLLVTWDDHDYGRNDGGSEYAMREESKQIFLEAWQIDERSPRHGREGIYESVILGPSDQALQIVLLDTRTFRSPLRRDPRWLLPMGGRGPYLPTEDDDATMLGEEQWEWLEEQLERPARLRILVSSVQVLAQQSGWEGWSNMPRELDKLMRLIEKTRSGGVVIVSGDRHTAEISRVTLPDGRPLFDLTTSSLNVPLPITRPADNRHRIDKIVKAANFGELAIDWEGDDGGVAMRIFDVKGRLQREQRVTFAQLGEGRTPDLDGSGDRDETGDDD